MLRSQCFNYVPLFGYRTSSAQRVSSFVSVALCGRRGISSTPPRWQIQTIFKDLYERQCVEGGFREDGRQRSVVEVLDRLYVNLTKAECPPVPARPSGQKRGIFSSIFGGISVKKEVVTSPLGVYCFGGVGTGKTMLMDLFLDAVVEAGALVAPLSHTNDTNASSSSSSASTSNKHAASTPTTHINEWAIRSKRVHFNDFMLDVHERAHKWKMSDEGGKGVGGDPFPDIAADLAAESALLCFDEFQVTDVADALIIHRLFDALFSYGVTMVATSNRPPEDLYKNGIQRSMFLPFISLLRRKCVVHDMGSERDYRKYHFHNSAIEEEVISFASADDGEDEQSEKRENRAKSASLPFFHTYDDMSRKDFRLFFEREETNRMLGNGSSALLGEEHADSGTNAVASLSAAKSKVIRVMMGRKIKIPLAVGSSAFFNFEDLCSTAVGAADFLAIASNFTHVYMRGVPILSLEKREQLRRFITLVDVLYERKVQLVLHAESELSTLFRDERLMARKDQKVDEDVRKGTGEKKEVDEEFFAFDRTASRLMEMQTQHYLSLVKDEERRRARAKRV